MDQGRVTDFLNVSVGQNANASSPYTAILASPFSASSSQQGHIRLMTVNGSSTSNGTELAGGSYVAHTGIVYTTGSGGQFAAAVYGTTSGSIQTNATLSHAGMPSATIVGIEIWDSAGSPLRWWWGGLSTPITTSSGNTLSFASAAILATLVA